MVKKHKFVVLLSIIGLMAPAMVTAQEAGQTEDVATAAEGEASKERPIEEIIVTAQKREQALMDVGIAITALTGEAMYEMGVKSTQDIIQYVPGLMMQKNRGTWTIRGVGTQNNALAQEGATSVYVDDTYLYWMQGSNQQLYDIAQTEVLKGPQGTLFGRNATGGLIHFRTNNPTRESSGMLDLTLGDYNQIRAEAGYGGPLSRTLSGRVAALYHKHDGYLKQNYGDLPDQEAADRWGARGKLLWEPSEQWSVLMTGYISKQDTTSNNSRTHTVSRYGDDGLGYPVDDPDVTDYLGWRNPPGFDAWNVWTDTTSNELINMTGGSVKADWTGDKLSFTSVTAYFEGESASQVDCGYSPSFVCVIGGNLPRPSAFNKSLTQEFHLSGGERFRWIVGTFYLGIDTRGRGNWEWGPAFGGHQEWSASEGETRSLSGFGQIEYDISEKVRFVAGLRYTDETIRDYSEYYVEFPDGSTTETTISDRERTMDEPWSGKLAIEWFPSDTVMAYASYNRGTKSGRFNSLRVPEQYWEYGDEKLDAFEVGLKLRLGANTDLNTAVFYYDYGGYQIRTIDPISLADYTTLQPAEIYGGEAELFTRPHRNLDLAFGLSLLDATVFDLYKEVWGTLYFYPEKTMQQAPPYTFNTAATWSIPLGSSAGSIDLHGNFNFVGEQWFSPYNDPSQYEPSYTYGYASIKYKPRSQKWETYVWVRNMFNEVILKGGSEVSEFGFTERSIDAPRWFGITFRVNFGL